MVADALTTTAAAVACAWPTPACQYLLPSPAQANPREAQSPTTQEPGGTVPARLPYPRAPFVPQNVKALVQTTGPCVAILGLEESQAAHVSVQ